MTAPNAAFSLDDPAVRALYEQVLQNALGIPSSELDATVQKCFAVTNRLLQNRKDFRKRGADWETSTALALAQDFSFVRKGCGNPHCPTDKTKLLTQEKTYRCARCHLMFYCGEVCQRAHWKVHKRSCKPPEPEVKAPEPDMKHREPETA